MEYRSGGAASHLGKGLVTDVDAVTGIEHSGSTILPASDSAAANITVKAKGTGTLQLGDSSNAVRVGASTSNFGGMNRGSNTMTTVLLPVSGLIRSTLTIAGLGVNDLLFIQRSTTISTNVAMTGYSCTAAGEATIDFLNNQASTQSIIDPTFKYAYIKA